VLAQLWLAEKLGLPAEGCRTLDEFWDRWSGASEPQLPPALLAPSVRHHRDNFKRWLDSLPDRVFIVSADSALELIDRLLLARRPRAAFFAVHSDWDKVETTRLRRLLQEVATVGDEGAERYRLEAYDVSDALSSLGGRPGVSESEMAHLEFLYVGALDHTEHGIHNPERQICQSPSLFAQTVALTWKPNDYGEDPPAWRIDDPERCATVATATHRLLDRVRRTPGTQEDGSVNRAELLAWLDETRRLCAEYARPEIGDQCIGQLLARSSPGSDGLWPSTAVWGMILSASPIR
jgi:hypothetical protein